MTHLVVQLEDALHPSRVVGIFHAVQQIPGVVCVVDLSAIEQETLNRMLRQGPTIEETMAARPKKSKSKQPKIQPVVLQPAVETPVDDEEVKHTPGEHIIIGDIEYVPIPLFD